MNKIQFADKVAMLVNGSKEDRGLAEKASIMNNGYQFNFNCATIKLQPMKIILSGDTLILSFPYNEKIINIIRGLPSRRYDPESKHWTVPARFAQEVWAALGCLGFELDLPTRWIIEQEKKLASKKYESDLPLFGFQKQGAEFLAKSKHALLADSMGLGKTIQAIASCEMTGSKKNLVLAPKSTLLNWENEIRKWVPNSGYDIFVVNCTKLKRLAIYEKVKRSKKFFLIMGYETMRVDIEELTVLQDLI